MNLTTAKKRFPLIITTLIITLIILVVLSLIYKPMNSTNTAPEEKTPENSEGYNKSTQKIHIQEQDFYKQTQNVAQLRLSLPYQGQNFKLEYSYTDNQYTLTLSKNNPDLGREEFNQFLSQKNISSTSYLSHFTEVTE